MMPLHWLHSFIAGRTQHLGKLAKALSISVLNQVVSSGANFLLGIYLVHTIAPAAFGLYGIGFAIIIFYAGIGKALFLTQMAVNAADRPVVERDAYTARVLVSVTVFCMVTFAVIAILVAALSGWSSWVAEYAAFCVAVAAASCAFHLKDYFVSQAFVVQRESRALAVNVAVAVVLAGLLWLRHRYADTAALTAAGALAIYAGSNFGGALFGGVLMRPPLQALRGADMRGEVREGWLNGRWDLITHGIYTLRTQAHTMVAAVLVGPQGVGFLNAARLLITPVALLIMAAGQIMLPRLAEMRQRGRRVLLGGGALTTLGLLAISAPYATAVAVYAEPVAELVLGPQYEGVYPLVIAWCLFLVVSTASEGGSLLVRAAKMFKWLTWINAISALAVLAVMPVLTWGFGLQGTLYGLILAELILAVAIWRRALAQSEQTPERVLAARAAGE